jgi:hypothetical protein
MLELQKADYIVLRLPDLPFRDLGGTPKDMNMKVEVESALRRTETDNIFFAAKNQIVNCFIRCNM